MDIFELYEQLKNVSRSKGGELYIEGFSDEDYEDLYYLMLEALQPYYGNQYEYWYMQKAHSYHRYQQRYRRTYDWYDSHIRPLAEQSIREQMVVLKWFTQRRYYGAFPANVEKG